MSEHNVIFESAPCLGERVRFTMGSVNGITSAVKQLNVSQNQGQTLYRITTESGNVYVGGVEPQPILANKPLPTPFNSAQLRIVDSAVTYLRARPRLALLYLLLLFAVITARFIPWHTTSARTLTAESVRAASVEAVGLRLSTLSGRFKKIDDVTVQYGESGNWATLSLLVGDTACKNTMDSACSDIRDIVQTLFSRFPRLDLLSINVAYVSDSGPTISEIIKVTYSRAKMSTVDYGALSNKDILSIADRTWLAKQLLEKPPRMPSNNDPPDFSTLKEVGQ